MISHYQFLRTQDIVSLVHVAQQDVKAAAIVTHDPLIDLILLLLGLVNVQCRQCYAMAEVLSQSTRDAMYAASIVGEYELRSVESKTNDIGGLVVLISAICLGIFVRSRRRRARRRRLQDELAATAKPRRQVFIRQELELPSGMAERFRRKDECVRATLGDAYAMHSQDQSMLLPRVHLPNKPSSLSLDAAHSYMSMDAAVQRESTPTIISRLSANKLKMAVDWMKSQGEKTVLPRTGVLKNQASKPNLAPRKLVKHARLQSRDVVMAPRPMSL